MPAFSKLGQTQHQTEVAIFRECEEIPFDFPSSGNGVKTINHQLNNLATIAGGLMLAAAIALMLAVNASADDGEWEEVVRPNPQNAPANRPVRQPGGSQRGISRSTQSAPTDFSLPDLNGNVVKLSGWRGHPVLVYFWATWCPYCQRQIPTLNDIYSRYHSRGLVIVGVSDDAIKGDGALAVAQFVSEHAMNYPIVMADKPTLDRFNVSGFPRVLLVARDGRIVREAQGVGEPSELSAAADSLMSN